MVVVVVVVVVVKVIVVEVVVVVGRVLVVVLLVVVVGRLVVVVVEVVFAYPGLGWLMVDSVSKRDLPVIQACGLIFASVYVLLNISADVLARISNPRLLHPR